jgi:hypothetical protein
MNIQAKFNPSIPRMGNLFSSGYQYAVAFNMNKMEKYIPTDPISLRTSEVSKITGMIPSWSIADFILVFVKENGGITQYMFGGPQPGMVNGNPMGNSADDLSFIVRNLSFTGDTLLGTTYHSDHFKTITILAKAKSGNVGID